jgi:hypothetical protein
MRHKFTNFTRGSQLLGHFGFMFAAGLKGPLMVTAATFTGLCWWRVRPTPVSLSWRPAIPSSSTSRPSWSQSRGFETR